MSAPAFTSVSTRRTLGGPFQVHSNRPPTPPPPDPQPAKSKKVEFSQAVRGWVQRTFAEENQIPGIGKSDFEEKLKMVINQYANSESLDSVDWDKMPLPQEMIQNERNQTKNNKRYRSPSPSFARESSYDNSRSTNKVTPKKRKSSDLEDDNEKDLPIRKKNVFEDRISYPDNKPESKPLSKKEQKRQRKLQEERKAFKTSSKSTGDLEKRRQRFEIERRGQSGKQNNNRPVSITPEPNPNDGPVVGTSQSLEKEFLRLTSAPKPETVRPVPILRETLDLLKKKWRAEKNYGYICNQFKSLRQDLTVQHVRTEFTVTVYEIHARIALEKGDLGEYHKCQTQLQALHKQRLGGKPAEFLAYRILYVVYTQNRTEMNNLLANLTVADRKPRAVKHALAVRSALAVGNYHRFFKLYLDTPNLGGYLIDMFLDRERLAALAAICKTYRPSVDLQFITNELAFESDEVTCSFICDHRGENLFERTDDKIKLLTQRAGSTFDTAKDVAFRKVDIKGQI
ncbi:MAG: hypothetical protein M1831_007120 [Alyxoria varia]|nr:MAG: hypothetical protein M1831_007120 [Alyxoria varia]